MDPGSLGALESGFNHLNANKYYFVASTVMLLYDHLLTLQSEITYIWCRRFSLPTYLFFAFRYLTPLVCILNLFAQHDPTWIGSRCSHWIWVPVAMAPLVSAATGIILVLRTYALYHRAPWILYILVPIYLGQLGVMGWALPAGVPAQLPPGFVGCIPSEKQGTGNRLSAINIVMLVFDAAVFILTLARAIHFRIRSARLDIIHLITRDGILYFFVLFIVNLINVFLLSLAPPDLSAINSPFATIVAATLVSRLMLNLREASTRNNVDLSETPVNTGALARFTSKWAVGQRTFGESVMGMSDFYGPPEDLDNATGPESDRWSSRTTTVANEGLDGEHSLELETLGRRLSGLSDP